MKKLFITLIAILLPMLASADAVKIDGIYYNLITNAKQAEVTSNPNKYKGDVVIPVSVNYNGIDYSVTSIGNSAFYNCSGLTSVTIPNSVTSIGNDAFQNCSGLTSVTIPNSVTSIGGYAFSGTGWYDSQSDGILYLDNWLLGHKGEVPTGAITIPDGTKGIAGYAFSRCRGLTSVTIPNSVTSIGQSAFYGCSGLTSITIPNSVTSIGNNAFANCSGLTSVTIPNSVTSIGGYAFFGCSGLTSVTIPNSVTSIYYGAFQNCSGLTSVTCLSSPTSYGSGIFSGCTNINEVTFDCEKVLSLFSGLSSITKVTLTDKVTSIGGNAFSGCSGLTSVTIPNSVTSIGESAFVSCSGLTSVTIPNSVTSIGSSAFSGCSGLTSVIIGSGVTSISSNAFPNANLKKTIWLTNTPPSGYTYAKGAVNYVSNDLYTSLSNVIKYQFLSSYFDVDGIRYVPVSPSERTCDAIDCEYNESTENMSISSTVVYKGVTMTVKDIQPYLAYNNKFIKKLTVNNDGELANYAFTDCSNMQSVTLGTKVSAIGESAFQGCSSIEKIDIPKIVTVLNNSTFSGCTSLKAIKIKPKMTEIKNNVFYNCTSLKNVVIADSEEELELGSNGSNPIFSSCPLDSVYIGRNINYNTTNSYGYSPFYRNTSLRAVKITDKETEISTNEFYGCTNLQRVIIGDGVTTIGDWAFSGCQSLKYFAFGSQVQTIGKEAFSDCTSVIEIISKATAAPTCGSQALDDINKWDCMLYVPDGCLAAYQAADQWKDFFFSEEGEGTQGSGESGDNPDGKKCGKPTISIKGGKLIFTSKTSDVIFHYSITHSDARNDISNGEVNLTNTYIISVYASKEGYEDSKVARGEILVKGGSDGDLNGDGIINAADVVKLVNIISGQ